MSFLTDDKGIGGKSPKSIAIVLGGIAALTLGIAFCYFMRSCGKKKDGKFSQVH